MNRRYLVSPINGVLIYHRLGKQERHNADIPFERALLVLSDVSLTVSEVSIWISTLTRNVVIGVLVKLLICVIFFIYQEQYYDAIKLAETFSRYKTRVEVSHLRPVVRVSEDPNAWWHYAMLAGLQQKKMWYILYILISLCELFLYQVMMFELACILALIPSYFSKLFSVSASTVLLIIIWLFDNC